MIQSNAGFSVDMGCFSVCVSVSVCVCVCAKGIHLLFVSHSLVWVREMNLRVEDASVYVCACEIAV